MIPLGILFGIPLRMHLAFPVLIASAVLLGQGRTLTVMLVSLIAHEGAHMAMARALGQRFEQLELMPFGGVARMDSAISLRPYQEMLIALAGPAASLLLSLIIAAAGLKGLLARDMLRTSLSLALVNLLPALPLDGGRALRAVCTERLGRARATRLFVRVGVFLGMGIILLGVFAAVQGIVNPMLFLMGVYLIYAALKEKESLAAACIAALHGRAERLRREGMLPVRFIAADLESPPERLAARLTAGSYHLFALVDKRMHMVETMDEGEVLARVLEERTK